MVVAHEIPWRDAMLVAECEHDGLAPVEADDLRRQRLATVLRVNGADIADRSSQSADANGDARDRLHATLSDHAVLRATCSESGF